MPRPERPLDDEAGPLVRFAADLRTLRDRAGRPGYRSLAASAHYSTTTLSEAAAGRSLPSLPVTLAYVRACGGDPVEWERRWHSVAADLAADGEPTPAPDGSAPYVGLAAFQRQDAGRFFGREQITTDLIDMVREHRFVGVFGASGVGKSSVLRAGLLATTHYRAALMTPGPHPLAEYLAVRAESDGLLVVDQFEEVFTLCQDDGERHRFVTELVRAARDGLRVVLGVRADFYGHCARDPDLAAALRDSQLLVGPLTPDQLRRAITRPALDRGLTVENALLTAAVADAVGQQGALPLLSHALLETWRRRRGSTLALSGYQAAGGITHALARTAELTYEGLGEHGQRRAKALFLRLVALGEGTEDTRRRIDRDELDVDADLAAVLERLVAARLLTVDHARVEITHEALIHNWPRLQDWLAQDRAGQRLHRDLTHSARDWQALGHDPGALYRGARLAMASDWAADPGNAATLNAVEREFLAASLAADRDDRAATRKRTRRLRQLVALLSVLLVAAGTLTYVALRAERTAGQQRDRAVAQEVLAQALALRDTDPELAEQLITAAYRLAPSAQTTAGVLNNLDLPVTRQVGGTGPLQAAAFTPDRRLLAVGDDEGFSLWTMTADGRATHAATVPTLYSTALLLLGQDDRTLVVGDGSTPPELWDVGDPRHPTRLATLPVNDTTSSALNTNTHILVTSGSNLRVWDIRDPRHPTLLTESPGTTGTVTLSGDGRTLVAPASDPAVTGLVHVVLWSLADPRRPHAVSSIAVPTSWPLTPLALDAAGSTVAVDTAEDTTQVWHVTGQPRLVATIPGNTAMNGFETQLALSPDGRTIARTRSDNSVETWDISTPAAPRELATPAGHSVPVLSMAFDPNGRALSTVDVNGSLQVDQVASRATADTGGQPLLSPDGRILATSGPTSTQLWDPSGDTAPLATVEQRLYGFNATSHLMITGDPASSDSVWDVTDPRRPTRRIVLPPGFSVDAVSPDGHLVAVTAPDSQSQLWDTTRPARPHQIAELNPIGVTAFSPDGRLLAQASYTVTRLWDLTDPAQPRIVARIPAGPDNYMVFAPVGRWLAVVQSGGVVALWNLTVPAHPLLLSTLRGNPPLAEQVAFRPDGRSVAVLAGGDTADLWDLGDPVRPALAATLTGVHTVLGFEPDGHTLAVIGTDGALHLRETDGARAEAALCAHVPALSESAWDQYFTGIPYQPACP